MFKVLATSQSFSRFTAQWEPGDMMRSAGIDLDVNSKGEKYTEADFLEVVEGYNGIIVGADPITDKVLEKGSNLSIIAKAGVGYDNIDVAAATKRGIYVTFTPGGPDSTVADSTFALMLAVARNIASGDAAVKRGEWQRRMGSDICGKKLGIIGLGGIGKQVALRAAGFDMEIFAADPETDEAFCEAHHINVVELETIFKVCDVVTVHAPLNEATHHLVDAQKIGMMKENALLINTARGGLVDEDALCDALKQRKIAGAGLDVFSTEPLERDHPLTRLQNVVLTPHTAGYSTGTLFRIGSMVAESVLAVYKGEVPPHLLNKEVLALR